MYNSNSFHQDMTISLLMRRTLSALNAAADDRLAPFGVTHAQFAILALLADNRANSPGTLCAAMHYDCGAMTRMLDRLETKGVIRRVRQAEGDRRAVQVELTAEGAEIVPTLADQVSGVRKQLLSGLSDDEQQQLAGYLNRMLVNISR